jgi:DNA polymerase III alpha subunit
VRTAAQSLPGDQLILRQISSAPYALGITAVGPIGMKLLFDRFLSDSRGEWPDIDGDLPSEEKRELAIQYVYKRYGEFDAAMTANVITYRSKSAAREVGKASGFDKESLGRLSNLVSNWECRGIWTDDAPVHASATEEGEVVYPHPLLEPVLKPTLDVPLFQEQLLRMAVVVANFSGAEANELHRAF